ncbi:hypothetical protein ACUIJN_23340 [Metabacillus halosaccharovorans]|uniref:hypothetical protein n=1 Tax=Metabacillus halosaccharovorans TaxID=930124 RepID=UPI00203DC45D|nr:hypothetical protein [Metabacillus halosaccharovorans]MCM3440210.1 hypothetical protein [Metabacillus halosaccharovorans]
MENQVRKKMVVWTIALATPLFGGVIYYFILQSLYLPSEDLFNFPVPRNAEVIQENEIGKSYDWSPASEENGIPFGYELVLKFNGWKKGEREGASVVYTKGNKKIDLISTTKHLNILKSN